MPDRRKHRGAHPGDPELFATRHHAALKAATDDLSWLLGRGYSEIAAVKLVGDRFALAARQRLAVRRAACSEAQRNDRTARRVPMSALRGHELWIDGFNVMITVESALSGGVLLRCRDGCLRDMASLHGTYRTVEETATAAGLLADLLARRGPRECRVLLDRPVSNSGRLRGVLEQRLAAAGVPATVALSDTVDADLRAAPAGVLVATADAGVLDACGRWVDLASAVVAELPAGAAEVGLGQA